MKTGGSQRYGDFKRHGMTYTPTHNSWVMMHKRCRNKNNPNYGSIGIKVCDRWLSFTNFYEDMGLRPDGMTLDRIESDKDYYKENCRWATPLIQGNNKRSNFFIELEGKRLTASQWSRLSGIGKHTIIDRIRSGMEPKQAIFNPPAAAGNARKLAKFTKP